MYKVLAVDDELLICKGLKSKIERINNPQIQEVLFTTDPLEVEMVVDSAAPSIVITDIRMPVMDGLTLMNKIKENHPHIKFVVLSGYDEFQYVKEAFKGGAVDYLLKPVKVKELSQVLDKAITELDRQHKRNLDSKKKAFEQILNGLLVNPELYPPSWAKKELGSQISEILPYPYFYIGLIRGRQRVYSSEARNIHYDIVDDVLLRYDMREQLKILYFFNSFNDFMICINVMDKGDHSRPAGIMQMLIKEINQRCNEEFWGSLSNMGEGAQELPQLCSQAVEALKYHIILPDMLFYPFKDIGNRLRHFNISTKHRDALGESIRKCDQVHAGMIIDEVFKDSLWKYSIQAIQEAYETLYSDMIKVALQEGLEKYQEAKGRDFFTFKGIEDIKKNLKDCAAGIIFQMKERVYGRSQIDMAIKYIKENFHKDINMALVANQVSMNYSYFSKQFKKETGINFFEYLTKIRMEEARRLLLNPTIKINEIAEKTGYKNYRRFVNAFKNYFGVTPNEFRAR